ncbi:MAG: HNH endonuclease [Oligoflexia bacterium]|nr:HNH endonuclease [Oligoflexia bacterium]
MINLKSMHDDVLLLETRKLVQQEREILSQILHHLREIERRRLFSKLKYSSLFAYALKELGYNEDQAYRRIQAMRLVKELPEIEEKINDGSLNLTHLGMAQSLFKREGKTQKQFSKSKKIEVLEKLENTSKREAEKIAVSFSTSPVISIDKVRAISESDIEIKFTAKKELLDKIQKLKGLRAHKNPNLTMSELMDELCDLALEKWDKSKSPAPERVARKQNQNSKAQNISNAQVRREAWLRDKGQCQICGSHYALEIDHQHPKALGGLNSKENLRLLCRSCNQRAAIEAYGINKMAMYIDTIQPS